MRFNFVAGVIPRERLPAFEKMLWRACRGNAFMKQADIDEPIEDPLLGGGELRKSVFIIFFQGDQVSVS
jgi:V-type H+-transporting ATPase subunit a